MLIFFAVKVNSGVKKNSNWNLCSCDKLPHGELVKFTFCWHLALCPTGLLNRMGVKLLFEFFKIRYGIMKPV